MAWAKPTVFQQLSNECGFEKYKADCLFVIFDAICIIVVQLWIEFWSISLAVIYLKFPVEASLICLPESLSNPLVIMKVIIVPSLSLIYTLATFLGCLLFPLSLEASLAL